MRLYRLLCFAFAMAIAASGQAMLEHSLISAASAAAGAGASSAGKSVGGVFQKATDLLNESGAAEKVASNPSAATPAKQVSRNAPAPNVIDASSIKTGMDRDELLSRFGQPLLSTIDTTTSQIVETMWYATGRSTQVQIRLLAGKVASISPPPPGTQVVRLP